MPNEPSPCAVQIPIRCFPHGDARKFGAGQAPQPITAPAEFFDETLAGDRVMHGAFDDRPKLRQHFAGVCEKERLRPPSHLVFELMLADRMNLDPLQALERGRAVALPVVVKQLLE